MRPLFGMASVDKRRPSKRRALRPAGRRSLPFGHSPERLILPKNRQTNHSRHKAHRPLRAAALRGFPLRREPPGKMSPPARGSLRRELPSPAKFHPSKGTAPTKVPSANVSPRRPRCRFRPDGNSATSRMPARSSEGSGPMKMPPWRSFGKRFRPLRRPAKHYPSPYRVFQRHCPGLWMIPPST